MNSPIPWHRAVLFAAFLSLGQNVYGFAIGPGPRVDEIFQQSDIIFKGTFLEDAPTKDPNTSIASFKVISLFMGPPSAEHVSFQHINNRDAVDLYFGDGWAPKHYTFTAGKTYLICAKHTDTPGLYQQLLTGPTLTDYSVTPCQDDHPFTLKSFQDALCTEMIGNLAQADTETALRLVGELDSLSGGTPLWGITERVFDRKTVMAGLSPLIAHADPKVAQAAIRVIGSASPYLSDDETITWLNTKAAAKIVNVGIRDPGNKNVGGNLYRAQLLAMANSKNDAGTRALAISSLGLLYDPAFMEPLKNWLVDPSPAVRRSAALLLADFPVLATREQISLLMEDTAPEVRAATALTMGILQQPENANRIAMFLDDPNVKVRQAAVASLVTFSPQDGKIAAIFHANVDRREFAPIFFNALALDDPAMHLDGLAKVVAHNTESDNPWIGETPHLLAWEILLAYLQSLPPAQLKSGKFDPLLDAMGKVRFSDNKMDVSQTRGLHPYKAPGLEKVEEETNIYNFCVPAIIYTFFVQHGMADRAQKYHLWSMKIYPAFADNLDALYDMVNENPTSFAR